MTDKIRTTATQALGDLLRDDMTIMSGGFGLCGIPATLIDAVLHSGVRGLTLISNNPGSERNGLGKLFATRQVRKLICSYAGENALFASQYLAGEIEVTFTPQGTLAERIRAGGAGIPAFYTRTGVGTEIAHGKPSAEFDGVSYILERGLRADLALIHAYQGDTEGNLVYRMTARNFNPLMATAADATVAEVEHLLPAGALQPDHIVTPGIFIDRLLRVEVAEKPIEQRTVREKREKQEA
ncbi:CoA transferase subunit A [Gluconacetobacter sp. Hr-1-5]|uniref:CoA transferase subunit A n=1 Tax=Gluconacetobacter sp. Hr-1-5 TaxID=3395370 RepID=UPI003B52B553